MPGKLGPENLDLILAQSLRRFTHVRRFFAGQKNAQLAQNERLMRIVRNNCDTAFGRKHNFASIKNYEDFKSFVPPSTYEDLEPYIEKSMRGEPRQLTVESPFMFATTSGTTARAKFIPITAEHLRDYTHAFQVHNYHLIEDFPAAASGKFLIIASNDEEGRTSGNLPYGAVSGLLNKRQSAVVRRHFALPYEICKVKEVDAKYYLLLRAALVQRVTALLGCNPSSFLLLADQLRDNAARLIKDIFDGTIDQSVVGSVPEPVLAAFAPYMKANHQRARQLDKILNANGKLLPLDVFPDAGVLSCWKGGSMGFYLSQLKEYYGDLAVRDFGYMASEGRGTVPIANSGAAGPLALTSHFFEFVEESELSSSSPRFMLAHELEVGRRYFIYFTTAAGLYRYNINDLIEVEGKLLGAPLVSFVRKGGGVSSITGEKLTEEQVLGALSRTFQTLDMDAIRHFTTEVVPERPPYYLCYAEVDGVMAAALRESFLNVFDSCLRAANPEYEDKRASKRLGPPQIQLLAPGTYARIRQQRVMEGAPEAQVKIPLLSPQGNFGSRLAVLAGGACQ